MFLYFWLVKVFLLNTNVVKRGFEVEFDKVDQMTWVLCYDSNQKRFDLIVDNAS